MWKINIKYIFVERKLITGVRIPDNAKYPLTQLTQNSATKHVLALASADSIPCSNPGLKRSSN